MMKFAKSLKKLLGLGRTADHGSYPAYCLGGSWVPYRRMETPAERPMAHKPWPAPPEGRPQVSSVAQEPIYDEPEPIYTELELITEREREWEASRQREVTLANLARHLAHVEAAHLSAREQCTRIRQNMMALRVERERLSQALMQLCPLQTDV